MPKNYRIALVEDDDDQRKVTREYLGRHLDGQTDFLEIVSEERFRSALTSGGLDDCDAVVMDVMLPWTSLEHYVPMPDYLAKDSYYRGGIRCIRELRSSGRVTPVVVYTLLEPHDIVSDLKHMEGVTYVNKFRPDQLLEYLSARKSAVTHYLN